MMASAAAGARVRAVVVLLAAVLGAGVTARLGVWQLDRAAAKQERQRSLDLRAELPPLPGSDLARDPALAAGQHYRRVQLRGEWVARGTVFLENRQMNGRTGFYVVTPFKLAGSDDAVLVQRGWAPRDLRDRHIVPPVASPAGVIELTGTVVAAPSKLYDFQGSEPGAIRQNLELADFSVELGLPLRPLSVQLADSPATAGDGLLREWAPPALGLQKHYGYTFQWFALSALITGLYVWFQLIRPRRQRRSV